MNELYYHEWIDEHGEYQWWFIKKTGQQHYEIFGESETPWLTCVGFLIFDYDGAKLDTFSKFMRLV